METKPKKNCAKFQNLKLVLVDKFSGLVVTYLPSFGAFPWEFSKNDLFFRMLFLVFFTAGLHKECIRCHTASWLAIGVLTTAHLNRLSLLDWLQMLIVLIIYLVILLNLMLFLYMLILNYENRRKKRISISEQVQSIRRMKSINRKKNMCVLKFSDRIRKQKIMPTFCCKRMPFIYTNKISKEFRLTYKNGNVMRIAQTNKNLS